MSKNSPKRNNTNDDAEVVEKQNSGELYNKAKILDYLLPRVASTLALTILILLFSLFLDVFSEDKLVGVLLVSNKVKFIYFIVVALLLFQIWSPVRFGDKNSLVALDERKRKEKQRSELFKAGLFTKAAIDRASATAAVSAVIANNLSSSFSAVSGYDFITHMRAVVESLDYQIDYAEAKASRLLEVGLRFVKGGILLYVISIIVWQGYLYYINFFMGVGVVLGMVSTTAIFLIMEFLGAWYLKQYRHYGDSAFSYMKVRSSYNKYMLAYCAIVEFSDDKSKSKEDILRVLAEKDNWPELKDVNSNDFNYMVQSIESLGVMFEKLKGIFSRSSTQNNPG